MNAGGDTFPIVGPGWTLNYEMFFYVAFALAMTLPRWISSPALIGFLAVLAFSGYLYPARQASLAFYQNPILLEFAAGVVLGHLALNGRLLALKRLTLPLGILGILWCAGTAAIGYEDMALRFWVYGFPAALIVTAAVLADLAGRSMTSRAAVVVGDASYSIYLTHLFVVRAMRMIIDRVAPQVPAAIFVIVCVGISIGCGIVVARSFEIPLHRLTRRLLPRKITPLHA